MLSFHLFLCLPCLLPFHCALQDGFARPGERETCPYHFSLRLFTMVRMSSCGPSTCWILLPLLTAETPAQSNITVHRNFRVFLLLLSSFVCQIIVFVLKLSCVFGKNSDVTAPRLATPMFDESMICLTSFVLAGAVEAERFAGPSVGDGHWQLPPAAREPGR